MTYTIGTAKLQRLVVEVMVSTVVVLLIVVTSVNVPRLSAVVGVVVTTSVLKKV